MSLRSVRLIKMEHFPSDYTDYFLIFKRNLQISLPWRRCVGQHLSQELCFVLLVTTDNLKSHLSRPSWHVMSIVPASLVSRLFIAQVSSCLGCHSSTVKTPGTEKICLTLWSPELCVTVVDASVLEIWDWQQRNFPEQWAASRQRILLFTVNLS